MTVNVELLRKVVDHMRRNPECWDQRDWGNECGTTHCFGGWVLVLGKKPEMLGKVDPWVSVDLLVTTVADLLGITYEEANGLCYTGMGDTLERYLQAVTAATGVTFEEDE